MLAYSMREIHESVNSGHITPPIIVQSGNMLSLVSENLIGG